MLHSIEYRSESKETFAVSEPADGGGQCGVHYSPVATKPFIFFCVPILMLLLPSAEANLLNRINTRMSS